MAKEHFQTLTEPMYYISAGTSGRVLRCRHYGEGEEDFKGAGKRATAGDALCHAAPVCGGGNDLSDCGGGEAQVIPDYGKRQADAAGGIHPADGSGDKDARTILQKSLLIDDKTEGGVQLLCCFSAKNHALEKDFKVVHQEQQPVSRVSSKVDAVFLADVKMGMFDGIVYPVMDVEGGNILIANPENARLSCLR